MIVLFISNLPTGIAYENDGGALVLETYSEATVYNCLFEANEAADNGGAIFVKTVSFLKLGESILRLNKAKNNGGSILVQNSMAIIKSCTFSDESVVSGFGGAIIADNVANVTIQGCLFNNCTAENGGSISVVLESVLKIENSNVTDSLAKEGGSFYIVDNSFVTGHEITIADGNATRMYGGAIYCTQSWVTFEYAILLNNYAELEGGGVFGETCQATFDHCKFVNNTALAKGGGISFIISLVEVHNSETDNNFARMGNFGFIAGKSKFESNYLHFPDIDSNWIWIDNSMVEMNHTYLSNLNGYCLIIARKNSRIFVDSVYLTNANYTRKRPLDSDKIEDVVCTDDTSSESGTFGGNLFSFLKRKKSDCENTISVY